MLSANYGYDSDPGCTPITFLVVHVKPYGMVFACLVDAKGPTPEMVRMLSVWNQLCGLVNFRYTSGKEHAIVRLIEHAVRE